MNEIFNFKLMSLALVLPLSAFAQGISPNSQTSLLGFFAAKEFNKEIALRLTKSHLVKNVIEPSKSITKFDVYPLAASNSGEITSVAYRCREANKEGLVLCFFNDSWNNAGVIYSGYAFKNLALPKAQELLNEIETAINKENIYISKDNDNNNICFAYEDMVLIIYKIPAGIVIRIFWNGFDSEWNYSAFMKTQKSLAKKLSNNEK